MIVGRRLDFPQARTASSGLIAPLSLSLSSQMPAIPVEAFYLTPGAAGSLQQQIRAMVTQGILSDRFRPAARMPSSRGLAEHLGVSRITVTLAYAELVSADYLTARGRSGYYISENAPRAPELPALSARAEGAVVLHR